MRILNSNEAAAVCTGETDGPVGCGTRALLGHEDVFVKIAQRERQYFRCPKCGLMSPLTTRIRPPISAGVPEEKLPEPEPVDDETVRRFWGFEQSTWSRTSAARKKTFLYPTKEKAEGALVASSEALGHISRVGDDQDNSEVGEYHLPRDMFSAGAAEVVVAGGSLLKYRVDP